MRRTSRWRSRWSPRAAKGSAEGGDFSLETADAGVAEEAEAVRTRSRDWVHGSGVQGLGIGDKLTHGEPTGELALRVYVEKKKARAKVANPVPKVVVVPGVGERITDVIELGRVVPELFTERVRPAMPGSGLGHTAVTVGTFGCLVRKKGDSTGLYVLSNAHVLANEGLAAPGDGIVQPGSLDGGTSRRGLIRAPHRFRAIRVHRYELPESGRCRHCQGSPAHLGRPETAHPRHRSGRCEQDCAQGHAHQESGPDHGLHHRRHNRRSPPPCPQVSPAVGLGSRHGSGSETRSFAPATAPVVTAGRRS